MTSPAVPDTHWLEPESLYLTRGEACEIDRPIYQGDVFHNVRLPTLPKSPVAADSAEVTFRSSTVMVIPHPCQCYYGDRIRPFLTVAPVKPVENYDNFTPDRSGAKDKFALPGLLVRSEGSWSEQTSVADLGRLVSVPYKWLEVESRIASLSHMGLGLLGKRILGFQLRDKNTTLTAAMALVQAEWNESFLMQAWIRKNGSLGGFTDWLKTPAVIPGLGGGIEVPPRNYRSSALDSLLAAITGEEITEP